MIIGSRYRLTLISECPKISVGRDNIKRIFNKKSLGLVFDEQLKWDNNNVQCKANSKNLALRKRKLFVPRNTLITLYNALILPYFNYCCADWNNDSYDHINMKFF